MNCFGPKEWLLGAIALGTFMAGLFCALLESDR